MKRHEALQDLSRDHYHALVHCQRIRKAFAKGAPKADLVRLGNELVAFFDGDLEPHFREEETHFLPAAEKQGSSATRALGTKARDEHEAIRSLFAELRRTLGDGGDLMAGLRGFEQVLTAHVRDEESGFFQALQADLPESTLQELWRKSHAFRLANRSPDACRAQPPPRA